MNRINLIVSCFAILFMASCTKHDLPVVFDLKCESLHNPAGIDKTTPRFSWKTSSTKNGTKQKAFQMLVASDAVLLKEGRADLWDSEGVTWAKTFKETPFGKLTVNWELKNDTLSMEIEIPVGTEAKVVLPDGVNKYSLNEKKQQLEEDESGEVGLQSGKYKISFII